MTAKTYVGVSSKAKNVGKIYVGVSSKARKVTKAYIGVSGKARLCFTSDFFLPSGIPLASCISAYRFKGAESETAAKKDLTGHGYNLKWGENVAWSAKRGIYKSGNGNTYIPWAKNTSGLTEQDIKSYVVYYGGYGGNTYMLVGIGGKNYTARFALNAQQIGLNNTGTDSAWSDYPCFWYVKDKGNIMLGREKAPASGVYGVTIADKKLYLNGTSKSLKDTWHDAEYAHQNLEGYGDDSQNWVVNAGTADVYGVAFFSVNLTAAQHKSIADAMRTW